MEIRHAVKEDIHEIMRIYEYARRFMAEHGNPDQWGPTNWPPEALIRQDIANGSSYVCIHEDKIVGTFFFEMGKEIEPAYCALEGGVWMEDSPYGVIHRLAGSGAVHGVGSFCVEWAYRQCGHLRMDTHGDNYVMQNLLKKSGFVHCGTVYVEEDDHPRMAYEKISNNKIAVISDIHGNYIAFQRCLSYVLGEGIRTFIFLGDYLGEFPYPQKTMEILYSLKEKYTCFFLRGNKEDYWLDRKYNENCIWKNGNTTVGAMKYCYENLTDKDISFFESLPICREILFDGMEPILACHGSPDRNKKKMLPGDAGTERIMEECGRRYILCGHTHIQGVFSHGGKVLLNPGSAGAALGGGGKAQFMILNKDGEGWGHQLISLDYDKESVVKEMKESGLWDAAPYWCRVTRHVMLTGELSQGMVLGRAMELCAEEAGGCDWYNIPEKYWEEAVNERMPEEREING